MSGLEGISGQQLMAPPAGGRKGGRNELFSMKGAFFRIYQLAEASHNLPEGRCRLIPILRIFCYIPLPII